MESTGRESSTVEYGSNENDAGREKRRHEHKRRREKKVFDFLAACRNLSASQMLPHKYTVNEVKEMISDFASTRKASFLKQLAVAIAEDESNELKIHFCRTGGAVQALVRFVSSVTESEAQLDAVSCLINLSTGEHKTTKQLVSAAAPYLIIHLASGNASLQELSAWALGNMAADCGDCCSILTAQGILAELSRALDSVHVQVVTSVLFALEMYVKTVSQTKCFQPAIEEVLTKLSGILNTPSVEPEVQERISSICFHLSVDGFHDQLLINTCMLNSVVLTLCTSMEKVDLRIATATWCVRCLGNVSADEGCVDSILKCVHDHHSNFADSLKRLLDCRYIHLQKETLWFLGNLASFANGANLFYSNESFWPALERVVSLLDDISDCGTQALVFVLNMTTVIGSSIELIASYNPFARFTTILKRDEPNPNKHTALVLAQRFSTVPEHILDKLSIDVRQCVEDCRKILHETVSELSASSDTTMNDDVV